LEVGVLRILILITAFVVLLLDRVSKALVVANIPLLKSWPVIDGFFYLTYTENTGAAFGLFPGWGSFLVVLTVLVGIGAALFLRKMISTVTKPMAICFGLIIGGALGNFIDRIFWGYVVDFLDFRVWKYIFNVADSALVVGSIMLAIILLFGKDARKEVTSEGSSAEHEGMPLESEGEPEESEGDSSESEDKPAESEGDSSEAQDESSETEDA
jgi:signal peptidase II